MYFPFPSEVKVEVKVQYKSHEVKGTHESDDKFG